MRFTVIGLAALLFTPTSHAETYNFYFGGKKEKKDQKPDVVVKEDKVVEKPKEKPKKKKRSRDWKLWRLSAGFSYNETTETKTRGVFDSDLDDPRPFWEQTYTEKESNTGFGVTLSFFPARAAGVSIFMGQQSGFEFEVTPLGAGKTLVEFGLMAGFSGPSASPFDLQAVHGGARLSLNFTDVYAFTFAGRTSLANVGEEFKYVQAEGGLGLRF